VELRNPNKGHYPLLAALLDRCFQPSWDAQGLADRVYYDADYDPNHVWMAREKGQVLGVLVSTLHGDHAWLKLLAVDPEARRKGLATDMLSRAEYRLSGEGAKRMLVEGTPPFEFLPGVVPGSEAEAFFRSQGYTSAPTTATWVKAESALDEAEASFDKPAAIAFARAHSGAAWPWVEETLGFQPARLAFRAGQGLILAEPGHSLGPLWMDPAAAPGAETDLIERGRAIAASAPCLHPQGLRFWQVPGSAPWPASLSSTPRGYLKFSKTLA
jgi:GNAT superfamily N-acetyltransferase